MTCVGCCQPGPAASTDDYLAAIRQARPTVTETMVREFNEDIEAYARL